MSETSSALQGLDHLTRTDLFSEHLSGPEIDRYDLRPLLQRANDSVISTVALNGDSVFSLGRGRERDPGYNNGLAWSTAQREIKGKLILPSEVDEVAVKFPIRPGNVLGLHGAVYNSRTADIVHDGERDVPMEVAHMPRVEALFREGASDEQKASIYRMVGRAGMEEVMKANARLLGKDVRAGMTHHSIGSIESELDALLHLNEDATRSQLIEGRPGELTLASNGKLFIVADPGASIQKNADAWTVNKNGTRSLKPNIATQLLRTGMIIAATEVGSDDYVCVHEGYAFRPHSDYIPESFVLAHAGLETASLAIPENSPAGVKTAISHMYDKAVMTGATPVPLTRVQQLWQTLFG